MQGRYLPSKRGRNLPSMWLDITCLLSTWPCFQGSSLQLPVQHHLTPHHTPLTHAHHHPTTLPNPPAHHPQHHHAPDSRGPLLPAVPAVQVLGGHLLPHLPDLHRRGGGAGPGVRGRQRQGPKVRRRRKLLGGCLDVSVQGAVQPRDSRMMMMMMMMIMTMMMMIMIMRW